MTLPTLLSSILADCGARFERQMTVLRDEKLPASLFYEMAEADIIVRT